MNSPKVGDSFYCNCGCDKRFVFKYFEVGSYAWKMQDKEGQIHSFLPNDPNLIPENIYNSPLFRAMNEGE